MEKVTWHLNERPHKWVERPEHKRDNTNNSLPFVSAVSRSLVLCVLHRYVFPKVTTLKVGNCPQTVRCETLCPRRQIFHVHELTTYPKTCVVFLALPYNLIFTNNVLKKFVLTLHVSLFYSLLSTCNQSIWDCSVEPNLLRFSLWPLPTLFFSSKIF